jgi:hypothetical protein
MSGLRFIWLLGILPSLALLLLGGCGEAGGDPEQVGTRAGTQYEVSFLGPSDLNVEIDNVSFTMPFSFWCDEGAIHDIYFPSPQSFSPDSRYIFQSWTHPDFVGNPATLVCDGPKSTTVVVSTQHNVTFTTNPVGLDLEIDGMIFNTPWSVWWDEGSTHDIYARDCPPYYWWVNWSDGGDQGHSITITASARYAASYISGHEVIVTTDPLVPIVEVDGVNYEPPASMRWEDGTIHTIGAPSPQVTPNGTLFFSHWSDGGAQFQTIIVNASFTLTAYYTGTVQVTIDTLPTFQEILVDGTPYITPKLFYWDIGSIHTVEAHEEIAVGQNASLRFSHWSDGGARSHSIIIEESGAFIAHYDRYYLVAIDTVPRGLNVSVDGQNATSLALFWWKEDSMHDIKALSPQERNRTRFMFMRWDDGNYPRQRTVVAHEPRTLTAIYMSIRGISAVLPPDPVEAGYVGIEDQWLEGPALGRIKTIGRERELSRLPRVPR